MNPGIVTVAYIGASILFILSLGGLSNQERARRGNWYGIIGMAIAIVATILAPQVGGYALLVPAMIIGALIGATVAKRVEMTQMPQLVAMLHSFVGLAAVLIGIAGYIDPGAHHEGVEKTIHEVEVFLGVFIGAITFTGSVETGKRIAHAAADRIVPAVLELGGSDPCIVLADADLDAAADIITLSRIINAGQSCIAAKRILVEAPVYDAVVERLHARLRQQMHQNGNEPGCTLTLLEILPTGAALLFHVGDSRLYAVNADHAQYLTVDHIPVTRFAMMRLVNRDEWFQQAHIKPGYQISQAFILGNSLNNREISGNLDPGLFELHDGNLPSFLQGLGDRRNLPLQTDQTYLLASDGLWHLQQPMHFVERWPTLLGNTQQALSTQLDVLFQELVSATQAEPNTRGDNCTAIAFRVRP